MSLVMRNLLWGFRPCPTLTAEPQKMARGLKFPLEVVEGFHYCGYHAADLRL